MAFQRQGYIEIYKEIK